MGGIIGEAGRAIRSLGRGMLVCLVASTLLTSCRVVFNFKEPASRNAVRFEKSKSGLSSFCSREFWLISCIKHGGWLVFLG